MKKARETNHAMGDTCQGYCGTRNANENMQRHHFFFIYLHTRNHLRSPSRTSTSLHLTSTVTFRHQKSSLASGCMPLSDSHCQVCMRYLLFHLLLNPRLIFNCCEFCGFYSYSPRKENGSFVVVKHDLQGRCLFYAFCFGFNIYVYELFVGEYC